MEGVIEKTRGMGNLRSSRCQGTIDRKIETKKRYKVVRKALANVIILALTYPCILATFA